jgi:hypothetical protein
MSVCSLPVEDSQSLDAENINTGLKKRESSITAYAVKA